MPNLMFHLKVRYWLIYCFGLCVGGAPLRLRFIVVVFYLMLSLCCHNHFAIGVELLSGTGTTETSSPSRRSTDRKTHQAAESYRSHINYFIRPLPRRQAPPTPMVSLRAAVVFRPLVLPQQTPIFYLERKASDSNSLVSRYYRLMDGRPSWFNDIQEARLQSDENDPKNDDKPSFRSSTRAAMNIALERDLRAQIRSNTTIQLPMPSLFRVKKRLCGKALTNEIKRLCTPNGYSLVCIHSSAHSLELIKRDKFKEDAHDQHEKRQMFVEVPKRVGITASCCSPQGCNRQFIESFCCDDEELAEFKKTNQLTVK